MRKSHKPNRLTQARLNRLIAEHVAPIVREQLAPEIKRLSQPVTKWGEMIQGGHSEMASTTIPGHGFAAMIRCFALGRGNPASALHFAKGFYGENSAVHLGFKKAMAAGDLTAGGFMIPEAFSNEVIELLRPLSVVRALQPRSVRIPRGQLSFPRLTGSATASYVGENQDIPISEPSTGEEVMSAKKLTTLVVMSNELIKFSRDLAEGEIRDVMLEEIAKVEDLNLLRGDGTENLPKGILNRINAANVLASNGTTAANVEDDFKDLINALESNDVRFVRPAWVMHPTQKNHLRNLRDANGNLMFPEVRQNPPVIYGYPLLTSTQVPNTEVYLVEGGQVVLGEVEGIEIVSSNEGSYLEGATLRSAFSRDQTLIRVVMHHDIMLRHDVAAAVINDVVWG